MASVPAPMPSLPPSPPTPEDDARRERAAFLRAWESTTLTRANFCVLKRLTEAQFEALLTQARQDPQPPRPERSEPPFGDRGPRHEGRRDDRGPRQDARPDGRPVDRNRRPEGPAGDRRPRPASTRPPR